MKAIGYAHSYPIDHPDALIDVTLPEPVPGPHDLVVEVRAISVNPVDTKVRVRAAPPAGEIKVLGWDVAGVVSAVGDAVSLFKVGDAVWYAGAITRPGANSERHVVDERIVGHKPASLDFAHAAALPLTSITAYELLFDRLQIARGAASSGQALLVIGAAGGVGSILIQLARALTDITIIATASRPESQAWVADLGAHQVIDHSKPLADELARIGIPSVHYVASLTHTDQYFDQIVGVLAPQGRLALIDDPDVIDVRKLKGKSLSLHWESMFTRSSYGTADMIRQHDLLDEVAGLVDQGQIRTTLAAHFGTINAAHLIRAHALLESGTSRGKIVLEGFER